MRCSRSMSANSYEQLRAEHRWEAPAHYNIASDVCDKHPRDKPAMVWESFDGSYRELAWGELQDLANQAAHVLRDNGVQRGDRVAVVLPPTPETAAIFFGTWKLGALLLSMSVLYGDEGIRHRLNDSTPTVLVTDRANAPRFDHEVTNVFTTPTAMRSMMTIADAGTRYPQRFRRVCSAGEPLNPEAIRWFRDQYGLTVLDFYGLTESYPLCANFPFMEVREGSMGKPMPGWEVAILDEDEQPVAPGERGEICMRARSNPHYPLGHWNRPASDTEAAFGGE